MRPHLRRHEVDATGPADPDWGEFGFDAAAAGDWAAAGFDAFEAALALGDGLNLMAAVHDRSLVRRVAADWTKANLRSVEGLHWHQGAFRAHDALRWRSRGRSVATAMAIRDGHVADDARPMEREKRSA